MTQYRPHITLKRLVVSYGRGNIAYEETFDQGVNIIRGENSSGKSTIADFIFYVLGGDYSKWKKEAGHCDYVIAEVDINETIITLKREISGQNQQAMAIFFGPFEEARQSAVEGWQKYPYSVSSQKESFSNVLFDIIGLPEIKVEDTNLTMHQLLRLIYNDQVSSMQSLMRDEKWDLPLTRATIRDLLFGVYDESLYGDKLKLREKKKKAEEVKQQFNSLLKVLREVDQEVSIKKVETDIEKHSQELEKINNELDNINQLEQTLKQSKSFKEFKKRQEALTQQKQKLTDLENAIERKSFEVEDSRQFIESLENRLVALNNSGRTRDVLDEIPLTHCPHCLSVIQKSSPENICFLCKQEKPHDIKKSHLFRMRKELTFQIEESKTLLDKKEKHLNDLLTEHPLLLRETKKVDRQLQELVKSVKTNRDRCVDDLIYKQGSLDQQLTSLFNQLKAARLLKDIEEKKKTLAQEIAGLNTSIYIKEKKQESRLNEAMTKIEYYTSALLRSDQGYQDEFKNPKEVSVNFSHNTFAVDGENNFSASSNVYLKNCVHFGIFFVILA